MIKTYHIIGMDCANCAKSIETGVAKLDGVTTCILTYHSAKLKVEGEIAPEMIVARVRQLGYTAILEAGVAAQKPAMASDSGIRGFVCFLLARRETALALLGLPKPSSSSPSAWYTGSWSWSSPSES
jgi:copper chaperone CopZ